MSNRRDSISNHARYELIFYGKHGSFGARQSQIFNYIHAFRLHHVCLVQAEAPQDACCTEPTLSTTFVVIDDVADLPAGRRQIEALRQIEPIQRLARDAIPQRDPPSDSGHRRVAVDCRGARLPDHAQPNLGGALPLRTELQQVLYSGRAEVRAVARNRQRGVASLSLQSTFSRWRRSAVSRLCE